MPKGAIHHLHLTASCSVDFLISLTYDDIVYYSDKDSLFKVFPKGGVLPGYIKVNDLRQHAKTCQEFDEKMK